MRVYVSMLFAFLLACPAHAESDPVAERQATIQKIVDEINGSYIDPEKVKDLAQALQGADFGKPMGDEALR